MARFAAGVVVVGASAAGLAAADGLREGGYAGPITVLDAEPEPGYDRPMLSKGMLASKDNSQPAPLRSSERLAANGIQVLGGHRAMGLDIDRRFVVTNWGEAIPWSQVIVATGVAARPLLTREGSPLPTLRTREDLAALRSVVTSGDPVTIIGAGFIGLEVAAALRSRDVEVRVLGRLDLPLLPLVGDQVAGWLLALHRAHGVRFEVGTQPRAVTQGGSGYDIELPDGRVLHAPRLLAGIGSVPNADWLIGSGVDLDAGVVIDAAGRTNVGGVWAAGDVAAVPDGHGGHRRFEHWTHAIEQGRHVGLNVARGQSQPYAGIPYVWTEQYGHTIHLVGQRQATDQDILLAGDLGTCDFVVGHATDGVLHAITMCDRTRTLRTVKKLLRCGAGVEDAAAALATSAQPSLTR